MISASMSFGSLALDSFEAVSSACDSAAAFLESILNSVGALLYSREIGHSEMKLV